MCNFAGSRKPTLSAKLYMMLPRAVLFDLDNTDAELAMSPAQQRELTRRLASFDRDKSQAVTWESLKAELAARAS